MLHTTYSYIRQLQILKNVQSCLSTRNMLIGSLIAGFIFLMNSCKKDYTCVCTVNGQTITIDYPFTKKRVAKTECDDKDYYYKTVDAASSCDLD